MKIGWVGLGAIGTEMVKRLLKAGHDVAVYERGAGLDAAVAAGARTSADYRALAESTDVLGLCVYDDAQLRAVMFEGGALAAMSAGKILAIHTTGSPRLAQELGSRAPEGVEVLDATFSGGPAVVEAGQLTLMVGGTEAALDRLRPMFETYCAQIHHVGDLGNGQVLKLLNNLLLGTNQMYASEALRLAEACGLDPALSARVIKASSGGSFAMNLMARTGDTAAVIAATRPYLVKDIATAVAAATDAGLDISPFEAIVDHYHRPLAAQ